MYAEVKSHISRNKKEYIVFGTCFVIGFAGGVALKGALTRVVLNVESDQIVIKPIAIFAKQIVTVFHMGRQGPPSWITECVETGEKTLSQRAMSALKGISQAELSQHLNGKLENVDGLHFKRVALAA
jgi:hypothetical protein